MLLFYFDSLGACFLKGGPNWTQLLALATGFLILIAFVLLWHKFLSHN